MGIRNWLRMLHAARLATKVAAYSGGLAIEKECNNYDYYCTLRIWPASIGMVCEAPASEDVKS
jgi:hypothetical protein